MDASGSNSTAGPVALPSLTSTTSPAASMTRWTFLASRSGTGRVTGPGARSSSFRTLSGGMGRPAATFSATSGRSLGKGSKTKTT